MKDFIINISLLLCLFNANTIVKTSVDGEPLPFAFVFKPGTDITEFSNADGIAVVKSFPEFISASYQGLVIDTSFVKNDTLNINFSKR